MRLIIVSNRLPVTLKSDSVLDIYNRSIGGVATGIDSFSRSINKGLTLFEDYLWIGWPGTYVRNSQKEALRRELLDTHRLSPVFLSKKVIKGFYEGFCNSKMWPLFHRFTQYVEHGSGAWECYQSANEFFNASLNDHLKENDVVWIHDYHLMLLPRLIRVKHPDMTIGFFLHIPFPPLHIFIYLPPEEQTGILMGLLSADLIGFHTIDYADAFLDCVREVLHLTIEDDCILMDDRQIKVSVFPMGIDYKGFSEMADSEACISIRQRFTNQFKGQKILVSVDRLDYTKGVLNRLEAFMEVLSKTPEWKNKLVMVLVVAPSRANLRWYKAMENKIARKVAEINGLYGTSSWMPVRYQYKQLDHPELCALFGASDIALVTPLRDGMNLVAKEFIASHTDKTGVLIISRTAGAVYEMTDALQVDPADSSSIAAAMLTALEMSPAEQMKRNESMHNRLMAYDVEKWAADMLEATIEMSSRNTCRVC